jgi:hypothetical protein
MVRTPEPSRPFSSLPSEAAPRRGRAEAHSPVRTPRSLVRAPFVKVPGAHRAGRRPSPSRRALGLLPASIPALLLLGAAASSAPGTSAAPQEPAPVEQIVIGGVTPRFAVPECVPRGADEASQAACRTITQVLRNDLRFEGLFQFVPDSLLGAIPPTTPTPRTSRTGRASARASWSRRAPGWPTASSPSRCGSTSWTPAPPCSPGATPAGPTTPASSPTRRPTTS